MIEKRRGRPPKEESQDARLGVRLSADFLWEVRAAAAKAHVGLGEYVRVALAEKMERDA